MTSPDMDQAIIAGWDRPGTAKALALQLGVSVWTVRDRARALGLAQGGPRRARQARILELHHAGFDTRTIARAVGVRDWCVRWHVRRSREALKPA